ncbi:doxorubicin resistance ABC transporter permease protein DrrB [Gordonia spumicola]|uniref:Doxorubicin resistance ABC transporter permease protein DrrB n=1 Tax=Gordonia spumicola TaxID=589161 RepID=A0A7I9V3Z7_9ACTN|nr:ABC transporter permease [Gordonia spumicola]GED99901.1 doxorubicin resistance ABC transporter permease protein DrrB [Gordonia spumicola]
MTAQTETPRPVETVSTPTGLRTLRQWQTLTVRGLKKVLRNGEFVFAFIAPAFLALCFYLPLRKVMDATGDLDYGSFLMPIILLQAMSFAATSAAMRAAFDVSQGINTRFRVLPMPGWVPLAARIVTNVALLVVSMVCGVIACLIIGWRPGGGVGGTAVLFATTLGIGLLLALLADGLGLVANSPEATSQVLGLPTMILGMASTGFVPEERFPEWIQPFARNQPISQFVAVLRGADSTEPLTWSIVGPTVYWCIGIAVVAIVLIRAGVRKAGR